MGISHMSRDRSLRLPESLLRSDPSRARGMSRTLWFASPLLRSSALILLPRLVLPHLYLLGNHHIHPLDPPLPQIPRPLPCPVVRIRAHHLCQLRPDPLLIHSPSTILTHRCPSWELTSLPDMPKLPLSRPFTLSLCHQMEAQILPHQVPRTHSPIT